MTRLNRIINQIVVLNGEIKVSVEFGVGNGINATGHKWNTPDVRKFAIDEYRHPESVLDDTWEIVKSLDDVPVPIDVISMLDVLEHFEKEDGLRMLNLIESISRHVVLFVPRGFMKQDLETHPVICKENPFQVHRSGWEAEEFLERGYSVAIEKGFHQKPQGLNRPFDAIVAWR